MSKKTIKTLVIWGIIIAIVVTAIVLLVTVVNKKEETPIYQIEGTTLVQYNGKEEHVVIPKEVELVGKAAFKNNTSILSVKFESGSKATKIAMNAFEGCAALQEITFANSIVEISDNAFLDCVSLRNVELSNSVKILGKSAFQGCANLETFGFNEGLEIIKDCAFQDCPALISAELPSSLVSFGNNVYTGGLSLETISLMGTNNTFKVENNILYGNAGKEIIVSAKTTVSDLTINSTVEKIRANAFFNAESVKTLSVPTTVKEIEAEAFSGCNKLEKATVPFIGQKLDGNTAFDSIFGTASETLTEVVILQGTKVIEKAFFDLKNILKIELPNTITYVGESAFENCTNLNTIVNLPNNLEIIRDNTFKGCTKLSDEVINNLINDNLKVIGEGAFAQCASLVSIVIPENVKHIGIGAFEGCSILKSITVPFIGMGYEYSMKDGVITLGNTLSTNKIFGYIFSSDEESNNAGIIPNTLTTVTITGNYDIPEKAFINANKIESIVLNNDVAKINGQAFKGCSSLKEFVLPENLTSIGVSAFEGCTKLETVANFPAKLTIINDNLFYDCSSLTTIEINANITKIGKYAFYNCGAQIDVSSENEYFEMYNNSLYTKGLTTLIRYQAALDDEKTFTVPAQTKVIGEGAFLNALNLEEIIVPTTVEEIQQFAIVGCSNIKSLELPFIGNVNEHNTNVERNDSFDCIFAGAKPASLSLTISDGETIGTGAFSNNSYITEITLSDTFTEIESSAFEKCTALTKVNFGTETHPAQITKVGERAFSNCINLEAITLADTIKEIGDYAFAECAKIREITLPKSLEVVGEGVFMNCSSLCQIHLSEENAHYNVSADGTTLLSEDGKTLIVYAGGPELLGKVSEAMIQFYINGIYYYALEDKLYSSYNLDVECGTHSSKAKEIVVGTTQYKYQLPTSSKESSVSDADGNVIEGAKVTNNYRTISFNNGDTYYTDNKNAIYSSYELTGESIGELNTRSKTFNINDAKYVYETSDFFKDELKQYVVDSNVINLYAYAFSGASRLQSITLHDGIQTLGDGLFFNCIKLESVVLPSSISTINSKMFENCESLTTVTNISNITVVEAFAFRNCFSYADDSIFAKLTEIAQYAFEGCSSITSVKFSDSIETVANGTFKDCTNLSEVIYSDNIKSIGDYAFQNCVKLATYNLPESLEVIGREAFRGATSDRSLASLEINLFIPEKVTTIGYRAFVGANRINLVYVPETVTSIDEEGLSVGASTSIFTNAITVTETKDDEGNVTISYNFPEGWKSFTTTKNQVKAVYAKGEWEMKEGIPTPPQVEEETPKEE